MDREKAKNVREAILRTAAEMVNGSREEDYGNPENNFQTIANLWTNYLDAKGFLVRLIAEDVACMLILLKVSRIASGRNKEDNWIDIAGYAACGGEIAKGDIRTAMPLSPCSNVGACND